MATATWLTHEFTIYEMDTTNWNDVAGVYIFSGLNVQQTQWKALYVGITESFKTRHPNHERWEEAKRLGATHVHAKVVGP
jgi:hypothetical protein